MTEVIHFYLRDSGSVLASRKRGREVSEHLRELSDQPSDLIIDFEGVEAVTPPFLQEVLDAVQSAVSRGNGGRLVVTANLNDDVAETLGLVLEQRKQTLAFRHGTSVELLKPDHHLVETLREAQALKRFTANDLAKRLDINTTAAHQRLKPLLAAGVVAQDVSTPAETAGRGRLFRAVSPEAPHMTRSPRRRTRAKA